MNLEEDDNYTKGFLIIKLLSTAKYGCFALKKKSVAFIASISQ
jgi:hypothetical protein